MHISTRHVEHTIGLCVLGSVLGLLSTIIMILFWSPYGPLVAIAVFSVFFMATFIVALRQDKIFAFYYGFLYLYTVFTQIGYAFYPEDVAAVSKQQYYGPQWFYPYWTFTFLSFVAVFIVFLILHQLSRRGGSYLPVLLQVKGGRNTTPLFYLLVVAHNLVMLYFFITRYNQLGYYSQSILKGNKLFFYGFSFYEITVLVLYTKYRISKKGSGSKTGSFLLLMVSMLIFLAIASRSGQRIQLASCFVGLSMYVFFSAQRGNRLQTAAKLLLAAAIFLLFQNTVRTLRGGNLSLRTVLSALVSLPRAYAVSIGLKTITFQDYLVPSLTMITSMYGHVVSFLEVVKSNLANILVFVDYPSLGEQISRLIDPGGTWGAGYYILTEGYNALGWFGIIYNALILNMGLFTWEQFTKTDSREFNNFMTSLIAMEVFSIVRGQSYFFIKHIYFSFLPAIILFCMATGTRIKLLRKSGVTKPRAYYRYHGGPSESSGASPGVLVHNIDGGRNLR